MTFTLVVPFAVEPGLGWSPAEARVLLREGDVEVAVVPRGSDWEIRCTGLPSPDSASVWLPRLFTALSALMLDLRGAVIANWDIGQALPIPDPASFILPGKSHLVSSGEVYVVPDGATPAVLTANDVSVSRVVGAARVCDSLKKGLEVAGASRHFADERMRTAISLHAAAFGRRETTVALLLRAMVFEALAPPTEKHPVAVAVLQEMGERIRQLSIEHESGSEAANALESLLRELVFRRETSIRGRLYSFVATTLSDRPDATAWARRIRDAYDVRSRLLHDGWIAHQDAAEASNALFEAAELVLGRLLGVHDMNGRGER